MKTWETTSMQFQTSSKNFSSFFSYIICEAFSQLQIWILESIKFFKYLFYQTVWLFGQGQGFPEKESCQRWLLTLWKIWEYVTIPPGHQEVTFSRFLDSGDEWNELLLVTVTYILKTWVQIIIIIRNQKIWSQCSFRSSLWHFQVIHILER